MIVNVVFFAAAKEITQCERIELTLDGPANLADVRAKLAQKYPELTSLMENSAWSIDHAYATAEQELQHGSEIGLILPVSGG